MNFYNNTTHQQAFLESVVGDRAKYKPELFTRVAKIISKYGIYKTEEEKQKFFELAEVLEGKFKQLTESENEMGEVPEEFLDPLTFEIMKDPVLLPNGVAIDRPNIERHLLSDPCNPFTRGIDYIF